MSMQSFKSIMAVCGATALIMTATALTANASDQTLASDVRQTLGRFNDTVAVKIDQGHVYLKGQFGTSEEKQETVNEISALAGVTGVYDYTEEISGSNG